MLASLTNKQDRFCPDPDPNLFLHYKIHQLLHFSFDIKANGIDISVLYCTVTLVNKYCETFKMDF